MIIKGLERYPNCPLKSDIAFALRSGRLRTLASLALMLCRECGGVIRGEEIKTTEESETVVLGWPEDCKDKEEDLEGERLAKEFNAGRSQPGAEGRIWDEF